MQKSLTTRLLFILLKVMFGVGIGAIVFLPKLYNSFFVQKVAFFEQTLFYIIAFYTCYIISLGIIYVLLRILRDVHIETQFKKETEINLKIIAVLFMLLSIIIAAKTVFIPTILSLAVIIATFIASLSFYVLSQVFKVAIEYKHEVDSTI